MLSVTSMSRYITSATRYHPRYQSITSMYIRGLIPRKFAELAKTVSIEMNGEDSLGKEFVLKAALFV